MTGRVFLSAPDVSDLEASWMLAALRSGWAAPAGPDVDTFECEVAARLGIGHAVAVSSGTAALHLALLALGVTGGHVVIVPTLTVAATANAVVHTGATPYFVDCDPATGNLDPALMEPVLRGLRRAGRAVGAVVAVDLFGRCADYATLTPVCAAYGVPIVEDAADALGSYHHGRAAGAFGTAAALSFNGNKVMTTSGGGMLLTSDRAFADRARSLATQPYSYRLSNLLAALGRAQLRRLDDMIERRRAVRERYEKLFASVDGVALLGADDPEANCWLTTVVVDPARTGWDARALAVHLEKRDIETRPLGEPLHRQAVFAGAEAAVTGAAERLCARGLALPSGSALEEPARQRVVAAINDFLPAGGDVRDVSAVRRRARVKA